MTTTHWPSPKLSYHSQFMAWRKPEENDENLGISSEKTLRIPWRFPYFPEAQELHAAAKPAAPATELQLESGGLDMFLDGYIIAWIYQPCMDYINQIILCYIYDIHDEMTCL